MAERERVMFVMQKTLGDVLLCTTICHEFKRDHPNWEIHFYTNKPYDGLLRNNPDIDVIVSSDDWPLNMLFLEMTGRKFDRVLAPYQARPECNSWHQFEDTRPQHLVDFYWKRCGMHRPIEERECYFHPTEGDFLSASEHISMDVPRIALHGTTNVPTKDWPFFDGLVEGLKKAGYGCVQVGAKNDRKIAGAVDLTGKMSFGQIGAFLSKCAAFVGLDSGLSYLADAMKVPTLVIQGSTSPVTSGPISHRVVHLFAEQTGYEDCQVVRCHMNCRHEVNCNTRITVPMVLGKLEPILAAWNKPIGAGVN